MFEHPLQKGRERAPAGRSAGAGAHAPLTAAHPAAHRRRIGALLLALALPVFGCMSDETQEDGLAAFNQSKYGEAVRIWRKLARERNPAAQFNLGRMYELGVGVPGDYKIAARYYEMAARHGHAYAQGNLAVLYAYGRGVPQDFVQSYAWSTLAAANYSKWAKDERAAANRNLSIVASRMTGVELEAARRLVEQRLAQPDS